MWLCPGSLGAECSRPWTRRVTGTVFMPVLKVQCRRKMIKKGDIFIANKMKNQYISVIRKITLRAKPIIFIIQQEGSKLEGNNEKMYFVLVEN